MSTGASLLTADSASLRREVPAKATEWVNTLVPAYLRDLHGNIISTNAAFAHRFPPFGGGGKNYCDLIHPEDGARQSAIPFDLTPGTRLTAMHRWPTRQGWRWFSWEEEVLAGENGHAHTIAAVGFDTTRQKLSEELYLKLSRAMEQSPVAIIVTDTAGRAQYANPRYTQSVGFNLEDLLEKNQPVLAADHATPEAYQVFLTQVLSGQEWKGECSRQNVNGVTIWENVQVNAVRGAAGEVINLLCLREDVTERRNLERQLRQAQKMDDLGALASGIAHDFNNILAVINGYAELSRLQIGDPEKLEKNLNEIRRATQRAGNIVRQILMFSRKAEMGSAPVDFNQQLRELGAMLSETFPRNIPFIYNLADGLPTLLADQSQMQQIVLNLCVNARDAMPNGGTLTISTSVVHGRHVAHATADAGKKYLCFEVADTGTGMTEEVRRRLFEPFFTTKVGNQGTGLGLAVVYGIVTGHKGFIEVSSKQGEGTTFTIFLPLTAGAVVTVPPAPADKFPSGTENLLIVDDEQALRHLLTMTFASRGYKTACAANGLEAMEVVSDLTRMIDLVLLDLNMPGATGIEVLRVLNRCRPDVPALVISGQLSPEVRAQLAQMNQREQLAKPFSLNELATRVRTMLDAAKKGEGP